MLSWADGGALHTHTELPIAPPEEGAPVEAWVCGVGTRSSTALSPHLESLKAESGLTIHAQLVTGTQWSLRKDMPREKYPERKPLPCALPADV